LRRVVVLIAALAALLLPATGSSATRILGPPHSSDARAQAWAAGEGATPAFVRLARLYWRLAPPRHIRPELAYAQAAKETNFGRFRGVLDASFHNPCGLKRTAGGGNNDRRAHRRFRTWRQGVTAHLDHLALYAGAPGYPKRRTPDPRHFRFLHGSARTVQALGGAWAPSRSYGREIVRMARAIGLGKPRTGHVARPAPRLLRKPAPHFAEGTNL
jgi:N-acetylmuramoyl-L-alanine amidase